MKTIRQAIPNEEIAANMRNQNTRSTMYTRRYISECEAEARVSVVALTFGGIAVIALIAAIASTVYAMDKIEAKDGPILARSEMTAQMLHVLKTQSEKRK